MFSRVDRLEELVGERLKILAPLGSPTLAASAYLMTFISSALGIYYCGRDDGMTIGWSFKWESMAKKGKKESLETRCVEKLAFYLATISPISPIRYWMYRTEFVSAA